MNNRTKLNVHFFSVFSLKALCAILLIISSRPSSAQGNAFKAVGVEDPVVKYIEPGWPVPRELERVAVEVYFDLLPTKMRFSMPCYPSMVTENNIHFSNGWTETYDPKASSSCEILWDKEARYARMWIESQNPARIVVRARAAISDPEGYIAHSYIESGSPYGDGDWTDEWYYIYPDGTHTRHVRIYTGLAAQSLTVTDEAFDGVPPTREIPPKVVHEFHEDFVFGLDGHVPGDDINSSPITLIKPDGSHRTFSFKPYPEGFGDYRDANIKIVNLNSEFRPFTISMPYGIENETYPPEDDLPFMFQTWGGTDGKGYSTSLGHTLNWWHFRRTDKILEQVYLSGMTGSENPVKDLVDLERSWISFPRMIMGGLNDPYTKPIYDQAQRAYIIPGDFKGARQVKFDLGFQDGDEEKEIPVSLVNPVFVLKNWGTTGVKIAVDDNLLNEDSQYRKGYEKTPEGVDLVIWTNLKAREKKSFTITPE